MEESIANENGQRNSVFNKPGPNLPAYLVTYDPNVAQKYGLVDESEFWGD